jgi:hypothetical protein
MSIPESYEATAQHIRMWCAPPASASGHGGTNSENYQDAQALKQATDQEWSSPPGENDTRNDQPASGGGLEG